ncbi:MAG: small multidrug efflux protein [Herbiconiux sp.]|nr:small multidrug efflux protein [Herbiconiux sp.]
MDLITRFQDLVAQVPELLQPLIVALAGAVPFIEGEGAASIGILGGLHPVVAVIAGAAGNFLCVTVLVLLGSRARSAIVTRHRARVEAREVVAASPARSTVGATPAGAHPVLDEADEPTTTEAPTARRVKFQRALDRYGVPGVSLLGPLLLPTQFTATMLAASGVSTRRVLFWQGLAIAAWSTLLGVVVGGVVHAVG